MDPQYWTEGLVVMASTTQQPNALRTGKAAIRAVRKLERPRPLKIVSDTSGIKQQTIDFGNSLRSTISELSAEEILQEVETVVKHINNGNVDSAITSLVLKLCNHLKNQGAQLEAKFKDQLDRYFIALRNACREERLEMVCRLRLLEIIELRAMGWRINENISHYYKKKLLDSETSEVNANLNVSPNSTPNTTPSVTPITASGSVFFPGLVQAVPQAQLVSVLAPGEVLKSSGKFAKPTKIPGKNYFKDEIIIRNSDSGKVMGIKGRRVHMIEELSDTVISFQRVSQGAKDRLVQITGPSEDSIMGAKQLIEETIRRNASPVREKPEKGLYGSDSCSSLNSNNSDEGGLSVSMQQQLAANRRGQLMHSLSMNDATIGEYQYTVTVGKDSLRLSGAKLDLVRTAKLVLEEYFAGDALRSANDVNSLSEELSEHVFISAKNKLPGSFNNHCSLTQLYTLEESTQFQCSGDRLIPVQPSPSSPDIRTYLECNGHQLQNGSRRSSSSSSCEETFKFGENAPYSEGVQNGIQENEDPPPPDSSRSAAPLSKSKSNSQIKLTVVREPLFPNSTKEAFQMAEATESLPSLSAKSRRAQFAKTSDVSKDKPDTGIKFTTSQTTVTTFTTDVGKEKIDTGVKLNSSQTAAYTNDGAEDTVNNANLKPAFPSVTYTREFLLDCAKSPFCRVTPKDLPRIAREMPYVLKKVPELFDPATYVKQEQIGHSFALTRCNSYSNQEYMDDDEV